MTNCVKNGCLCRFPSHLYYYYRLSAAHTCPAPHLAAASRPVATQAIAVEEPIPISVRLATETELMSVDASYSGPHLPPMPPPDTPAPTAAELVEDPARVNANGISLSFVRTLMAEYKAQRGLARKYSLQLLLRANSMLRALPSLVHVPFPVGAPYFNVCGDTHGQYYDTLHIFGEASRSRSDTLCAQAHAVCQISSP